jgi:hypothetical protein
MSTVQKRVQVSLTKKAEKDLDQLSMFFGEHKSAVLNRALILLHFITFEEKEKECT